MTIQACHRTSWTWASLNTTSKSALAKTTFAGYNTTINWKTIKYQGILKMEDNKYKPVAKQMLVVPFDPDAALLPLPPSGNDAQKAENAGLNVSLLNSPLDREL